MVLHQKEQSTSGRDSEWCAQLTARLKSLVLIPEYRFDLPLHNEGVGILYISETIVPE